MKDSLKAKDPKFSEEGGPKKAVASFDKHKRRTYEKPGKFPLRKALGPCRAFLLKHLPVIASNIPQNERLGPKSSSKRENQNEAGTEPTLRQRKRREATMRNGVKRGRIFSFCEQKHCACVNLEQKKGNPQQIRLGRRP